MTCERCRQPLAKFIDTRVELHKGVKHFVCADVEGCDARFAAEQARIHGSDAPRLVPLPPRER